VFQFAHCKVGTLPGAVRKQRNRSRWSVECCSESCGSIQATEYYVGMQGRRPRGRGTFGGVCPIEQHCKA